MRIDKSLNEFAFAGIRSCQAALIVPVATGMALMLCMLSWKQKKPDAKYVIWSRIDQKSCFKSILTAGTVYL
jgi:O-phospho-L-seryl-tRNASec:L-selenocysteinyl-tRNA synthase